ncbi:unnamed protein product [Ranitomeya imitator]|uniref:Uncharacterized protein n=1 Tax=Ranitomeya imitator TaxID=111125 RepID=A0ABN9LRT0_9NEOB|nr:unnamed protein product [Ranitomeya imitator]
MEFRTLCILTTVLIFCPFFTASAWSVNNFLMTGPKAYLTYSTSVAVGAQSGIEECKFQFAWSGAVELS